MPTHNDNDLGELREAGQQARDAVAWRNKLLKRDRKKGHSYRELGEAVQLSHTGVRRIVQDGQP